MDEADERAWVAFASAVLGGLYASGYSSGRSPDLIAAEMADDMLGELRKRRGERPECSQCGGAADLEAQYGHSPDWHPICDSCASDAEETTREIAEHEMNCFGGAYGVPSMTTRPLRRRAEEPAR